MTDKELKEHKVYLKIAQTLATLSHCVSYQVAALIVKDGRILSTGINGTPTGFTNCDDIFEKENFEREKHHEFSEDFEVHAELNAIIFAAKNGISINGGTLYSKTQPCKNCLKAICQTGIKKIVFYEKYDKANYTEETMKMIKHCGIEFICIEDFE